MIDQTFSSNWITPMGNYQRSGCAQDKIRLPLRLKWKKKFGGRIHASPVISDGIFFLPLSPRGLGAYRVTNGDQIWLNEDFQKAGMGSASLASGKVIIPGKEGLSGFSIKSGDLAWSIKSNCDPWGVPCVLDRKVFWGNLGTPLGRELWAADIDSGEILWMKLDLEEGTIIPAAWKNKILISCGRTILAIDHTNGESHWSWIDDSQGVGGLGWITVTEEYVMSSVNGLICLGVNEGKLHWKNRGETAVSVSVDNQTAYVASSELRAISIQQGSVLWSTSGFSFHGSAPIVIGNHIIIGGGNKGCVFAFDRHTGDKLWEYPTGDFVYSTAAFANGHVLIGCHDGNVYCFVSEEE
jgi:outer membrane protein assembly factor BamB